MGTLTSFSPYIADTGLLLFAAVVNGYGKHTKDLKPVEITKALKVNPFVPQAGFRIAEAGL